MIFDIEQSLEFRLAEQRIEQYVDAAREDPVMKAHSEAMQCRGCEDFLAIGISAFKWLEALESTLRSAVYDGLIEWCDTYDQHLLTLYRAWLGPCQYADERIANAIALGFRPDNLDKFEEIRGEAIERVQRRDLRERSKVARKQLFATEPW